MKKAILFSAVILLFAVSSMEAQINKGRWLVGVSTSISYLNFGSDIMSLGYTTVKQTNSSGDDVKYTTFNFLPKAGYFVADNLVIGLNNCVSTSVEKSGDYKYTTTYLATGPFIRYYINSKKVMPFFEADALLGVMKDKSEGGGYDSSSDTGVTGLGLGAGAAFKLADKVTFDIMAGYNSLTAKAKQDNPDNEKTKQGTLGIKLGFTILLGSK
jgi:outer membrane protein